MPGPLTVLDEEERLFQSSVREFAKDRISPYVGAMDEASALRQGLLAEMFAFGLMGIEVKEEYGGQGGSFFQSVLAVEELAKVDPAVSVVVVVKNTLVTNACEHWGTPEQKHNYFSR
ncbi:MAG: acyl-CoA dehydrogenase family protein, partial [Bryobacteraceae bacterium]